MRRPRRERGREPRSGVIEALDGGLSRRWAGDGKRHICRARGRVGGWDTSARWFAYAAVPWTTDGITERPAAESLRRVSVLRRQGDNPASSATSGKTRTAGAPMSSSTTRHQHWWRPWIVMKNSSKCHVSPGLTMPRRCYARRSMCQDYGEYQKLESARLMSILLERLKPTARRGSKPRCHWLTHGPHDAVAARLADLVAPFASVASSDDWMPEGFEHTAEAQLGYADQFLTADRRAALAQWWLAVPRRANTPNWDLVSTCQVAGQKQGLLLVEAKAHAGELSAAGKTLTKRPSVNSAQNDQRIRAAIAEANTRLGGQAQGWHLTTDTHYQMSNRFAWAWKLADLGVPVVLVYLGFLNADEMGYGAFHSGDDWDRCLRDHAQGVVPAAAWNRRLEVRAGSGALVPLVPLIQTAHISLTCLEARPHDD